MVNASVTMGEKDNETILINFHGRNIIFDINLLKANHGSVRTLSNQRVELLASLVAVPR